MTQGKKTPSTLPSGYRLGPYRVGELLGAGGQGEVYSAVHEALGKPVALKALQGAKSNHARFLREGRSAAAVQHPHVVTVTDVGVAGDVWYLVMELLEGESLAQLLARESRLSITQAINLVLPLADALSVAHAAGIVHRDIKPSNVMLVRGSAGVWVPKLIDFGLSKVLASGDGQAALDITSSRMVVGSPAFMSPEQVRNTRDVDARTDQYSLAVLLYVCLAGTIPFKGDSLFPVLAAVQGGDFRPLVDAVSGLPDAFCDVVQRAMSNSPDDRYRTIQEFGSALLPWASSWDQDRWGASFRRGAGSGASEAHPDTWAQPRDMAETRALEQTRAWGDTQTAPDATESEATDTAGPEFESTVGVPAAGGWSSPDPRLLVSTSRLLPVYRVPERHTSFVGRLDELQSLGEAIDSGSRLITVLGRGGLGKTRLVQEFASRRRQEFDGGVWFCDLTGARTGEDFRAVVRSSLGLVDAGESWAEDPVMSALEARGKCLVLLDNLEQVLEPAAAALGSWLPDAGSTTFLATSRESLSIEGETVLRLESLPLDCGVQLFEDRARDAMPGFRVSPSNRSAVEAIVRRLDGLSLAIELAAARSAILEPSKLLDRLDKRFKLLSSGRRDLSARQATLWGAIDWSWDLLSPWEALALAQLGIFCGGLTLEAAEAVVNIEAWPEAPWVPDVMQRLVEKSLVRRIEGANGGMRFALYASIQEYALAQLGTVGRVVGPNGDSLTGPAQASACFAAHAEHYARLGLPDAVALVEAHGDEQAVLSLASESENLLQALSTAQASEDSSRAVGAAVALCVLARHGHGPADEAVRRAEEALSVPSTDPPDQARLLWRVADLVLRGGRPEKAVEAAEKAVSAAASGPVGVRVQADIQLARVRFVVQGRSDEAMTLVGRWVEDMDFDAFPIEAARAFGLRARLKIFTQGSGAEEDLRTALRLADQSGLVDLSIRSSLALATWLLLEGKPQEACGHYRTAYVGAKKCRNGFLMDITAVHLGMALLAAGELEEARDLLIRTRSSAERRGDRYCVYVAYVNLLDVLVELGDESALTAELEQATLHENPRLPATLRLGGAKGAANGYRLLANLGRARRILDDIHESIDFAAIPEFESAGYFIIRSRLEAQEGHLEAAEAALESAEKLLKAGDVREVHLRRSFDSARAAVERLAANQSN